MTSAVARLFMSSAPDCRAGVRARRAGSACTSRGANASNCGWPSGTKVQQSALDSCSVRADSYLFGLSALVPCAASRRFLRPMSATLAKLREPEGRTYLPPYTASFHEYSVVTKLYVGNLPFTATDEAVRALFSPHGTVEKVSMITDRDTGRPRGFGFVEMSNADAVRAMQALNGTDYDGRSLKVNEAQERERSGGGNRGGGSRRY